MGLSELLPVLWSQEVARHAQTSGKGRGPKSSDQSENDCKCDATLEIRTGDSALVGKKNKV